MPSKVTCLAPSIGLSMNDTITFTAIVALEYFNLFTQSVHCLPAPPHVALLGFHFFELFTLSVELCFSFWNLIKYYDGKFERK